MSPLEKMAESARTYVPAGYGLLRGVVVEYGAPSVVENVQKLENFVVTRLEAVHNRRRSPQIPLEANVVQLELPPAEDLSRAA